jgi:hypothetical protein
MPADETGGGEGEGVGGREVPEEGGAQLLGARAEDGLVSSACISLKTMPTRSVTTSRNRRRAGGHDRCEALAWREGMDSATG